VLLIDYLTQYNVTLDSSLFGPPCRCNCVVQIKPLTSKHNYAKLQIMCFSDSELDAQASSELGLFKPTSNKLMSIKVNVEQSCLWKSISRPRPTISKLELTVQCHHSSVSSSSLLSSSRYVSQL